MPNSHANTHANNYPTNNLAKVIHSSATHNHEQSLPSRKWHYLLSNNIQFADKTQYSIRLPKPEQSVLHLWVEKIVAYGQCDCLYIEDLTFDEVSLKRIKHLCEQQGVTLINIFQQAETNVVKGPW